MPIKTGTFTPREQRFMQELTEPKSVKEAAAAAGYKNPGITGHHVVARPEIRAEIIARQTERLYNEVLPLAVQVHIDILTDKKAPAGARAQLIKLAYDRALGAQGEGNAKEPHEMTAEEIAKALLALKDEAAKRAKPVIEGECAPVAPIQPLGALD